VAPAEPVTGGAVESSGAGAAPGAAVEILKPVAWSGGKAELTPENTSIGFIGAHTDDRPDRVGGFEKFSGTLTVDEAGKTVSGVTVDIDATSIWTEFGNLTNHLNSPDFFDTREYPTAKFESTSVSGAGDGAVLVKGKLTLHGTTQEIEFPAQAMVSDAGVVLSANFEIDRTQFGMDKMTQGVKPAVKVNVAVGKATQPTKAAGG
jgi:polyisoprenoid-binding protein YceI